MAIADEHATADAGMTNPIRIDEAGRVVTDGSAARRSRTEAQEGRSTQRDSDASGKRKSTDDHVESKVVTTTEGRPAGGFDSRHMRTSSDMRWTRSRDNYGSLLDRPCRNYGDWPASHTLRQCNLGRPRPPPRYERRDLPPPPNEAVRDDQRHDDRCRKDRNRDERQCENQRRECIPSPPPRNRDEYQNRMPPTSYSSASAMTSEADENDSRK